MAPAISIITPSYNQAQYLEQTIDSVLSQGVSNLEYIIIDGGSSDNSVSIIKKYAKHLAYWVSERDNGQSHAINKGLRQATGEVVNWLNSDDYYEPGALKTVADFFSDPATKVLCARSNIIDNNIQIKQSRGTDVYDDNLAKTIGWARIDQPETFFRREAFDKIGLLNENLHFVMDKEWWIRYLAQFGLDGITKSESRIVNFRYQPFSKTVSQSHKFIEETDLLFYAIARTSDHGLDVFACDHFGVPYNASAYLGSEFDENLLLQVFSYFFLHKADDAYYKLNLKLAKQFIKSINGNLLAKEDQRLLRKLRLRLLLPRWIIEKFRS